MESSWMELQVKCIKSYCKIIFKIPIKPWLTFTNTHPLSQKSCIHSYLPIYRIIHHTNNMCVSFGRVTSTAVQLHVPASDSSTLSLQTHTSTDSYVLPSNISLLSGCLQQHLHQQVRACVVFVPTLALKSTAAPLLSRSVATLMLP